MPDRAREAPRSVATERTERTGRVDADAKAPEQTAMQLPDKEYFKIGEVAAIVGVKPYVLRYWESEFKRDIRPERTRSNQRMYRRRDVETFLEIKRLRYEESLQVKGTRRRLRQPRRSDAPAVALALGGEAAAGPLESGAWRKRSARLREGIEELIRIVDEDERRG